MLEVPRKDDGKRQTPSPESARPVMFTGCSGRVVNYNLVNSPFVAYCLACDVRLLMTVLLLCPERVFFVVILRMRISYEAHQIQLGSSPNSTGKLAKFNWEAHQIQLGSSLNSTARVARWYYRE